MTSSLPAALIVGSRTSKLALWQTNHVIARLQAAWPDLNCRLQPFTTRGDQTLHIPLPQIGGKGLFTAELEQALLAGEIDLAVHSLKDLPVANTPGLTLGAITSRADVRDVLVSAANWTLDALPMGAVVGTSSIRRQAQLWAVRPDLTVRSIRGNVDTRLHKVEAGEYDAAVLAAAGLSRLELGQGISQLLPLEQMMPAPGQGALAVQCRADDAPTLTRLRAIHDALTLAAVTAERAFLAGLGGGCSAPVAAYAAVTAGVIHLRGLVAMPDGTQLVRVAGQGEDAAALGRQLARQALAEGAQEILAYVV